MTNREQILAEIKRLKTELIENGENTMFEQGRISAFEDMELFIDSMQEETTSKFDSCIQPGDDVRYNEELGCRVNLTQLQRVAKKDPKYCMYSKDIYTDEERKSLCDGCEEDCEYNQKKEPDELTHSVTKISDQEVPISEDLNEELEDFLGKNALLNCCYSTRDTLRLATKVANHFVNWQKQQMMKDGLDYRVQVNGMSERYIVIHNPIINDNTLNEGDHVKLIIIKDDQI